MTLDLLLHHRVVDGDDPEFDSFKCPPLLGQVVTVSGIDSEERGEIKRLVEKAGIKALFL